MRRFRCFVMILLLLSSWSVVRPQEPASSADSAQANAAQIAAMRKNLVERHFESTQPQRDLYGAVPGAHLLEQHRTAATQLQRRVQSTAAAGGLQTKAAASSTTVLPGIALRPTLPAGETPTSVVTGDFDRDSRMDFIVANGESNDLWFYRGKGDGTFYLPKIIGLSKGQSPVNVVAADLRGRGILDLVVAETDSLTVGVLAGNGDGTFGFEQVYALPQSPAALVVRDFNKDGKLDIAAALNTTVSTSGSIPLLALLPGDGLGGFGTAILTLPPAPFSSYYLTPWNLDAGDVNGDGLPDLLVTGPGVENSTVYLNRGAGSFTPGQTIVANLSQTGIVVLDGRLADVNEDGCLDAVVVNNQSDVFVMSGNCSGGFSPSSVFLAGDTTAAIRLADVNGDGHLDALSTSLPVQGLLNNNSSGDTLNVMLGDGKGNFANARLYDGPGQCYNFAVADFNGDGRPEVVTTNNDMDDLSLYLNDGHGGFGFSQGFALDTIAGTGSHTYSGFSQADLNGDGKPDLFALQTGSNTLAAVSMLNDGTGRFGVQQAASLGVLGTQSLGDFRLTDVRGTGHSDLLAIGAFASAQTTGTILFMPGNGNGTFGTAVATPTAGAQGLLATGDFNGDGKLDFAAVNGSGTYTLTPFLGNGDGTFRPDTALTFSDGLFEIFQFYSGDFNRDGKTDLLTFSPGSTGSGTMWEFDGNGDGTFRAGRQINKGFESVTVADLNGDMHPDLARYDPLIQTGSTFGPGQYTAYLNQPDGTFQSDITYSPYGSPAQIPSRLQNGDSANTAFVGDLNGDGKPDLLALQYDNQLYEQILMGNGDGTFTPTYNVFPFYVGIYPQYVRDLDGDNIADLLEYDSYERAVHVFKGARASALQLILEDEVVTGNKSCGFVFPNLLSTSARTAVFSSTVTGVQLPASVVLPASAASVEFCYTLASNFDTSQVFDVQATLDGDTATAYAAATFIAGFEATISAPPTTPIYAGLSAPPLTVKITSAGGYGSTVKLSCSALAATSSCTFGSNTLTLPPGGSVSTSVTFSTLPTATQGTYDFTITAQDANVFQQQTVAIPVAHVQLFNLNGSFSTGSPGTAQNSFGVYGIAPVTYACTGLPAGITCTFSGSAPSFGTWAPVNLIVTTPAGVAPGTYPFQIVATGGPTSSSLATTLQVVGLTVQGPASTPWIAPGSNYVWPIPITLQGTGGATGAVTVSCALDVGGSCSGLNLTLGSAAISGNLQVSAPNSAALGPHTIAVTATLGTAKQTVSLPVYVADFSGTLSAASMTMKAGSSGTLTTTLTASTGFTSNVTLACQSNAAITCSFSPATVALAAGTPQIVTVTMQASSLAGSRGDFRPRNDLGFVALAALLPFGWSLCRRVRTRVLLSGATLLLLLLTACGNSSQSGSGSSSSGTGGGGTASPTSYSVIITATAKDGPVTHAVGTVSLTVTH